jgi:hypothetical protein
MTIFFSLFFCGEKKKMVWRFKIKIAGRERDRPVYDHDGYVGRDDADLTTPHILRPLLIYAEDESIDAEKIENALAAGKAIVLYPILKSVQHSTQRDLMERASHKETLQLCSRLLTDRDEQYRHLFPSSEKAVLPEYNMEFQIWARRHAEGLLDFDPTRPNAPDNWTHYFRAYQSLVWIKEATDADNGLEINEYKQI